MYTATPVWQDAEIKSSSNFSKSCPKCCQSSLNLKRGVFQNSPKAAVHLGYFWNKYVHPELYEPMLKQDPNRSQVRPALQRVQLLRQPSQRLLLHGRRGMLKFPGRTLQHVRLPVRLTRRHVLAALLPGQRTLTYFVRGSIAEWLTSCLTG